METRDALELAMVTARRDDRRFLDAAYEMYKRAKRLGSLGDPRVRMDRRTGKYSDRKRF